MSQRFNLIEGDVLTVLSSLPENYFDACLSDPPYGLRFMGQAWDHGVPSSSVYEALLRVMKPGAFGIHFGGTRTYHRLAVSLEDAGFEVRDSLMWVYGSGFPKSHNISKAIDKQDAADLRRERQLRFTAWVRSTGLTAKRIDELTGTNMGGHYTTEASQPAVATRDLFEVLRPHFGCDVPAWVEQLVDERTVESENFKKREVVGEGKSGIAGAFGTDTWASVEGTAVSNAFNITAPATDAAKQWDGWGTALKPAYEPAILVQKPVDRTFAANALTWGCGGLNVQGCRVGDEVISVHNAPTGSFAGGEQGRGSDTASYREHTGRFPANFILDEESAAALDEQSGNRPAGHFPAKRGAAVATGFAGGQLTEGGARSLVDTGGASRFFYCAKVSTKERNAGLADFADKDWAKCGACVPERENRPFNPSKNTHPTLKPIALTEYLARLLLIPPRSDGQPRRLLVPYAGAGSEIIGALLAGWDEVWGIELNGEYVRLAAARISHHTGAVALNQVEEAQEAA